MVNRARGQGRVQNRAHAFKRQQAFLIPLEVSHSKEGVGCLLCQQTFGGDQLRGRSISKVYKGRCRRVSNFILTAKTGYVVT